MIIARLTGWLKSSDSVWRPVCVHRNYTRLWLSQAFLWQSPSNLRLLTVSVTFLMLWPDKSSVRKKVFVLAPSRKVQNMLMGPWAASPIMSTGWKRRRETAGAQLILCSSVYAVKDGATGQYCTHWSWVFPVPSAWAKNPLTGMQEDYLLGESSSCCVKINISCHTPLLPG